MTRLQWGLVFAATCLYAPHVLAQSDRDNVARAETLFSEGRASMAKGEYATACSKFEASQALDPGVGTLLNLAECLAKTGRTASAWALFRDARSAAHASGSKERERVASERIASLEAELSHLTVNLTVGQDVSVIRDGVPVNPGTFGSAVPVDPGPHTIVATGSGKRAWSIEVSVNAGASEAVSVPSLVDDSAPVAHEVPVVGPSVPPPLAAEPAATPEAGGASQRVLAIVSGAIGLSAIATGTVFGLKANASWSAAKRACSPACDDAAARTSREAWRSGTISTIAFIIGGVGLAGGAVLWFSAPTRAEAPIALGIGPGALQMSGRF
jgi:hypothetical protein